MMEISKYGFSDLGDFDGARLAAQVVSGIGFLGAGMIFVHKNTISGLTTAAGIWATAGVGLAIGAATGNIPVCMCIGLACGVCLGAALDAKKRKDQTEEPPKDTEE